MDDLNNSINSTPMPENIPQNDSGSISGFDAVNDAPAESQGYTVTPQGGYYTRSKEDIIQDEAFTRTESNSQPAPEPQNESGEYSAPKTDYRPNGNYGAQQSYSASDGYNASPNPQEFYGAGYHRKKAKPQKVKKEKNRYSAAVVIAAAVLAAVIGAVSGIAAVMVKSSDNSPTVIQNTGGSNVNITVDEEVESVAQAVAEKVSQSVVGIRTTTSVMNFFGGSSESTGEGSGVIYTADGYIITNYHVIQSAAETSGSKIEVFLEGNKTEPYSATVVGYNISSDLAVIKINVQGLTPVELGDSSSLKTGQYVVTIGSPGGLEFMGSVTYGIISGLNRTVSSASKVELIQTDAAINPGNSGGALLNTSGQLIGINSSKIVSEEYEGMGFAIPVNTVVEKCNNIISKEYEPDPYIGISVSEKYTADVLEYYGFPVGAVVLSVDDESPAYTAGIRRGDIVTEFNGTALTDYTMLGDLLNECEPDQKVSVTIYRSGRYYNTNITIGSDGSD